MTTKLVGSCILSVHPVLVVLDFSDLRGIYPAVIWDFVSYCTKALESGKRTVARCTDFV